MAKRTYDTFLRVSYALGARGKVYDDIPSSTKHDWLTKSSDHIYGSNEMAKYAQIIISAEEHKLLKQSLWSITKLFLTYRNIVNDLKDKNQLLYKASNNIIRITHSWSGQKKIKRISNALNISQQQYIAWKKGFYCNFSPISLCRKKYANQLSFSEVKMIGRYISNPEYKNWSLISIYYKMLRETNIYLSDRTFYKYCRILGERILKRRKRLSKEGPRANNPLELLHMDITEYKIADNVKAYVHMVIDNYSRKILGYKISTKKNATLAFENLTEVYSILNHNGKDTIEIMSDDGSENKSITSEFMDSQSDLIHSIARKGSITCTNNMIESVFKKIKQCFIYHRDISNYNHFEEILEEAVIIYNEKMPLAALNGRTPSEAFEHINPFPEDMEDKILKAQYQRYMENINGRCF